LGDSSRPESGYHKKTVANDLWRLMHRMLREESFFVVGHDWGGLIAFSLAAQHRDAVKRMVIFDVPVQGNGTPAIFNNRWHHGLHWEKDFPEELTAGRGTSTSASFTGPEARRRIASRRKRNRNTSAPIVGPAR
jgi:pimeloyl-ACP methyl ester carboxylesterase